MLGYGRGRCKVAQILTLIQTFFEKKLKEIMCRVFRKKLNIGCFNEYTPCKLIYMYIENWESFESLPIISAVIVWTSNIATWTYPWCNPGTWLAVLKMFAEMQILKQILGFAHFWVVKIPWLLRTFSVIFQKISKTIVKQVYWLVHFKWHTNLHNCHTRKQYKQNCT